MTQLTEILIEPEARLVAPLRLALSEALAAPIDRSQGFYGIDGMSGARYRHFINGLLRRLGRTGYLEVGSWMGSTLCSAIHGNAVQAVAIDNWSQFGGPRDAFLANLAQFRTAEAAVEVIEADFRSVGFAALAARHAPFEVYLFDGPHEEQDQHDGLIAALPALAEEFVFICDDWNWWPVRAGTHRAVVQGGLQMLYGAEIRTTQDNSHPALAFKESDWHNGYFISVLRQPRRAQAARLAA
ncbi:class I SAM-dependent methyltransferase [Falsiroseomonas selenitidurans]|uniref:Class I SAM-dependent methyltransferase n=1 Tax=Falsiroseomonas selenitidurans TaxID=2716335 RepID=A0ABX1E2K7_9PROT|nr:class I SAM-dependent methyltransferase [Falsiroseomonas selenitidurans]NKC29752.1 class I SAM-dependent methyltransferase [Falsiroseomonas selenitidurans]